MSVDFTHTDYTDELNRIITALTGIRNDIRLLRKVMEDPEQGAVTSNVLNDLQKAINFSSEIGADRINIIGVEGGSNQHQFASYWCLFETEVECYIHLSDSIVSMVKNGEVKLSIEKEREFSIFAIGDCDGVNVSGGKWQLSNEKLTPNSRGLHNLANDETITISCNNGMLLVFRSR